MRKLNERHEVRWIRSSTGNVESEKKRKNCDFEGDRKEGRREGRKDERATYDGA